MQLSSCSAVLELRQTMSVRQGFYWIVKAGVLLLLPCLGTCCISAVLGLCLFKSVDFLQLTKERPKRVVGLVNDLQQVNATCLHIQSLLTKLEEYVEGVIVSCFTFLSLTFSSNGSSSFEKWAVGKTPTPFSLLSRLLCLTDYYYYIAVTRSLHVLNPIKM